MIECDAFHERAFTRISATVPNGTVTVTRHADGVADITLRNGDNLVVSTGGFTLEDSEGPVGTPLTYRVTSTPADRVIQENYALTPNFTHGAGAWASGTLRTATVVADSTADHPAAVLQVTGNSGGGGALLAPPTLIGHLEGTNYSSGNYTLTPPTSGGTAIANGDWVFLIHHQLASAAAPTMPTGFTLVASYDEGNIRGRVWRRKRVAGDTGYTVTVPSGGNNLATLLWVRGGGDAPVVTGTLTPWGPTSGTSITIPKLTAVSPSLVFTVAMAQTLDDQAPLGTGAVEGATWQYTQADNPSTRSTIVATQSMTNGGTSENVTVSYAGVITGFIGWQIALGNTSALASRVIAKGKAAAIPAGDDPWMMTGRFKYTSTDIWLWSDVEAQGTWANLLATKATWEEVRNSTVPGTDQAALFVAIVNPATGAYYVDPVLVRSFTDETTNTWLDFSFYFTPTTDIPTTAELWILHGSQVREYNAIWYLDSIGIIPGPQIATRDVLYYLDGDTVPPDTGAARMEHGGTWQAEIDNDIVTWTGTTGNSISRWSGPSSIYDETVCQLDLPGGDYVIECAPMMISDPVSTALGLWVGLLRIDGLTHPSRQEIYRILSRVSPISISQVRNWETGTISMLTNTLEQRALLTSIFESGRVLLIRNPDTSYPENNWYLGFGDLDESRVSPDHRDPLRVWTVPFVRVERPAGLIETSSGVTWAQVEAFGTWADLRAARSSWLDVMTSDLV